MHSSTLGVGAAVLAVFLSWLLFPPFLLLEPPATTGQHVIVTGASQGIGRALVMEYAKRGAAQICIASRSEEKLRVVAQRVMEKYPLTKVHVVAADISSRHSAEAVVSKALELMDNRLDVLLLNHITSSQFGTWLGKEDRGFVTSMFETNTFSYIWMATAAVESLAKSPTGGRIGVVSSMAGHVGIPKTAVYGATKHALHGFFNSFRIELRYRPNLERVGVTLCAIGATETEGAQLIKHEMSSSIHWDSAEWAAEAIVRGVGLRRREVFHPHHIVFPAAQIYHFFPNFLDEILLKTQSPS
jgi:short-subunit dehydrogenase